MRMRSKVLCALMACGVLTGVVVGRALAKPVRPPFTLNATFDGFCDVAHIEVSKTKDKTHKKSYKLSGFFDESACMNDNVPFAEASYWEKGKKHQNTAHLIVTSGMDTLEFRLHSDHTWEGFLNGTLAATGTWGGGNLAPSGASILTSVGR